MTKTTKKVVKKGGQKSGFADILGSLTQGGLLSLFTGSNGLISGGKSSPKKKVTIKKS